MNFTQEAPVTGWGVKNFKFDVVMNDIQAKAAQALNNKPITSMTQDGKPVPQGDR